MRQTVCRTLNAAWCRLLACLVFLSLLSCGAPLPPTGPTPPQAPQAARRQASSLSGPDGALPLDRSVRPTRVVLTLSIDPRETTFEGHVEIELEVLATTQSIRLHAEGLALQALALDTDDGPHALTFDEGPNGGLALKLSEPLPAGRARLRMTYTGILSAPGQSGLVQLQEGDEHFVFSQFEPTGARRVFPCFDEPGFPVPLTLTLKIPEGQKGVANASLVQQSVEGERVVLSFAETAPLPPFWLGLAVGPFEVAAHPDGLSDAQPLRVLTTPGKARMADFALEVTPELNLALTEYFGQRAPLSKLDLLAIPGMAPLAMETPGLLAFRESLLLLDAERAPIHRRRWTELALAHELAHTWLTLKLPPDEAWLGEALAAWLAPRVVSQLDEESLAEPLRLASQPGILASEVETPLLVAEGASRGLIQVPRAIQKGAAIFGMLDSWLGEDRLKAVIRRWLAEPTPTAARLYALLDEAPPKGTPWPAGTVARELFTRSQVELVQVRLRCAGEAPAAIELTRLPTRGQPPQGPLPVCVRVGLGDGSLKECFLLNQAQETVLLTEPGCPAWLYPNADEAGYYLWRLDEGLHELTKTWRDDLSAAERASLPAVLRALFELRELPTADYLQAITEMSTGQFPLLVDGVVESILSLASLDLDPSVQPALSAWVQALLSRHLSDEDEAGRLPLSSRRLKATLAFMGRPADQLKEARSAAEALLADPQALGSEAGETLSDILSMAAWGGDASLWRALVEALKSEPAPLTRLALITALASFEDPELYAKTLDLVLMGPLEPEDLWTIARGAHAAETRAVAWRWLADHKERLEASVGPLQARLPLLTQGACSPQEIEHLEPLLAGTDKAESDRIKKRINICIRKKITLKPSVEAWLRARR